MQHNEESRNINLGISIYHRMANVYESKFETVIAQLVNKARYAQRPFTFN